jgi:hypothetical protein
MGGIMTDLWILLIVICSISGAVLFLSIRLLNHLDRKLSEGDSQDD